MSTLESSFDQMPVAGQKTSGLAIASLVCSLICCLPVTTILGILLGIGAIVSIRGNPATKGMGLAVTGLVLGLIFTAMQAILYPQLYDLGKQWYALVDEGPDQAMAKGMSGDVAGFKASFHGAGATASDEEARAFLDAVSDRYGALTAVRWDQQRSRQQQYGPVQTMPYVFEFSTYGNIDGRAEIVIADPQIGYVWKLGSITIQDPDLGDLTYPPPPGQAPPGPPAGDADSAPAGGTDSPPPAGAGGDEPPGESTGPPGDEPGTGGDG